MAEGTLPNNQLTLVKYDNPTLVTTHDKKAPKRQLQV